MKRAKYVMIVTAAIVATVLLFCSCSSSRKSLNKSISSIDTSKESKSITKTTNDSTGKKSSDSTGLKIITADSTGTRVQEEEADYDRITTITFADSSGSVTFKTNGEAGDYALNGVKTMETKEKGKKKSKDTQQSNKHTEEKEQSSLQKNDQASVNLESFNQQNSKQAGKSNSSIVVKTSKRSGLPFWFWPLIIAAIGFSIYRFRWRIKSFIGKALFPHPSKR